MFRKTLMALPVVALAGMGVAQAQSGGGSMAYPESLPSGQLKGVPAARGRDTGSMAVPAQTGGGVKVAPPAMDTGSMGYPSNGASTADTTGQGAKVAAMPATAGDAPAAASAPAHARPRHTARHHAAPAAAPQ